MAELEATIAMPNGRMNGYDHGGLGAEGVVLPDAEQCVTFPVFLPTPDGEAVTSATQPTAEATAQCPPPTNAADKVKSSPIKAAGQSRQKPKTSTSKTAQKTESPSSRIRYVPQKALDADLAKLETLSRAALAGDTRALDELRAALDRCPHIWRRLADLEHLVELKLMSLVAGNDPLRSEAFRKRCSELRHHLLDGEPSSLATKMAASRLTITWLFVQFLELRALESPGGLHSIKQLEQAERRYQVAMRTFGMARQMDAQLRRLAQLNN